MKQGPKSPPDQATQYRELSPRNSSTSPTSLTKDNYSFYESVHRTTPNIPIPTKLEPTPSRTMVPTHPTAVPTNSITAPDPDREAKFTIQVASFQDLEKASILEKKLKNSGFPAYVLSFELPSQEKRYRVRVGRYSDRIKAEQVAAQIKAKDHLETWVTPLN